MGRDEAPQVLGETLYFKELQISLKAKSIKQRLIPVLPL
jgi:hypothetical protein